jgi:hypothetical protein
MRWVTGLYLAIMLPLTVAVIVAGWSLDGLLPPFGLGALFVAIQLLNLILVPRNVAKMVQQRPAILAETVFTWSDEGIDARSEAGVTLQKWATLHRWFQGRYGFVFLLTDRMMLIVPARALTESGHADLAETVERLGPKPG